MKTQLTNTSGGPYYAGWLTPHGRQLAEDEVVIIDGDLRSILASGGPGGRYSRKPSLQGLTEAIAAGDIEMVSIEGETESSSGA